MDTLHAYLAAHPTLFTTATAWFALSLVLNLLFRLKSPAAWVALAEKSPRIAALDKLLRAAGFDPAGILVALQQLASGKTAKTPPSAAEAQIERLAEFIMENVPGEPSQNQGAVDTAIRLLARQQTKPD